MNIAVINGPNLNMLGKRDTEQYGAQTLDDIQTLLTETYAGHQFSFYQNNIEGELVNFIHTLVDSDKNGLIANFGGFTHTSVAIRDALELPEMPIVEVHLSNIHARESFRERSLTGAVVDGIITGFGAQGYLLAVRALEMLAAKG